MLLVRAAGAEIEDWQNTYLVDFHALDAERSARMPIILPEDED